MSRVMGRLMKGNKQWLCTRVIELEARLQSQDSLYAQETRKVVETEQALAQVRQELERHEARLHSQDDLHAQETQRMIDIEQELTRVRQELERKQELEKKHADQLDEIQVRNEWFTYPLV